MGWLRDIPGPGKRRRKYGNTPVEVDGIKFASKREASRYMTLKVRERLGEISNIRRQVPYPLRVEGELICTYVADFVYFDEAAGRTVLEDAKGVRTPAYILKRKLMKACYGIEVHEV